MVVPRAGLLVLMVAAGVGVAFDVVAGAGTGAGAVVDGTVAAGISVST